MKLFKKLTYHILIIACSFLVFIIGISYFMYSFSKPRYLVCATEMTRNFCGTESAKLSENASKGKQIFNTNCAACHKLNMNMTGPNLVKTDSIVFWEWLTLKGDEIDTTKFGLLGIDYHKNLMEKTKTIAELTELFEYCKAK